MLSTSFYDQFTLHAVYGCVTNQTIVLLVVGVFIVVSRPAHFIPSRPAVWCQLIYSRLREVVRDTYPQAN